MSDRTMDNPLSPEVLVAAYAQGIFPMAMDDGAIGWFSPDPRGLIPLDERFHVPSTLRQTLRQGRFDVRLDTAFREVMLGCADRDATWISEGIVDAYCLLYELGVAHSVEAWQRGELVGGLYGLSLRGAFFGESMFTRTRDASKVCLVSLVEHLRGQGFLLLDTQWTTPHLERFGAYNIPRRQYLRLLEKALEATVEF